MTNWFKEHTRATALIGGGMMIVFVLVGVFALLQRNRGDTESDTPITSFFPESETGGPVVPPQLETEDGETLFHTPGMRRALWRVTETPAIASIAHTATNTQTNTREWYVRYIERETMHVYEHSETSRTSVRLSLTSVPRIQDAFFLTNNPEQFVVRYLDSTAQNIQTYHAKLGLRSPANPPRTSAEQENAYTISGSFLERDIYSIAPSPDGKIAYLVRDGNRSTGKVISSDGSITSVFTTPLREAKISWTNANSLLLSTKPSYGISSFAQAVSLTNVQPETLLYDFPTLQLSVNPTGDRMVVFYFPPRGSPYFSLYAKDGTELFQYHLVTLPEKCVWGRSNPTIIYCAVPAVMPGTGYPDTWYQGTLETGDLIWKIDTDTHDTILMAGQADFVEAGAQNLPDVVNMTLSDGDHYLTFIDNNTDAVWALRLITPEL